MAKHAIARAAAASRTRGPAARPARRHSERQGRPRGRQVAGAEHRRGPDDAEERRRRRGWRAPAPNTSAGPVVATRPRAAAVTSPQQPRSHHRQGQQHQAGTPGSSRSPTRARTDSPRTSARGSGARCRGRTAGAPTGCPWWASRGRCAGPSSMAGSGRSRRVGDQGGPARLAGGSTAPRASWVASTNTPCSGCTRRQRTPPRRGPTSAGGRSSTASSIARVEQRDQRHHHGVAAAPRPSRRP